MYQETHSRVRITNNPQTKGITLVKSNSKSTVETLVEIWELNISQNVLVLDNDELWQLAQWIINNVKPSFPIV